MSGELLTLDECKKVFWENVIELPRGEKRLVAKVDSWGEYDGKESMSSQRLFVPNSPHQEFDLVLSLATDGKYYPCMDLDTTEQRIIAIGLGFRVTPSWNNWHGWRQRPVKNWDECVLAMDKFGNDAYYAMNGLKGWNGLRPPWVSKNGNVPDRWKLRENYWSLNWDKYDAGNYSSGDPEPESDGVTLEDLFAEEVSA